MYLYTLYSFVPTNNPITMYYHMSSHVAIITAEQLIDPGKFHGQLFCLLRNVTFKPSCSKSLKQKKLTTRFDELS